MTMRPLKIVCYVPTFNAGDTTRGIEVTKALVRKARSRFRETDVTFVCPPIASAHFEAAIQRAGFKIAYTKVPLDKKHIDDFMTADRTGEEFVPDYARAHLYIEKYMENMREHNPDILINGCIPPAGIAAQILGIPTVTYLPFPADKLWLSRYLLKDVPDQMENALTIRLPKSFRRALTSLASKLATKQRFFRQPTSARAGFDLGWKESDPHLFSMLRADIELVNDLPDFYFGQELGPRTRITGPLFSRPIDTDIDSRILEVFAPEKKNKVLVTMGSSGEKRFLIEAVKAVSTGHYNAVVVVQPTICTIEEVRAVVDIPNSVYLTDSFIPAHQVNPLADAVIIHGGQGTVQNAISSGTPFVGVGMQAEQQTNLDNLVLRGAGIRIAKSFWTAKSIRQNLNLILENPEYKANAGKLAQSFASIDGQEQAGNAMWELVERHGLS
jgi:UDP:flavonoid glycosyltransferase YjiC (YdhE family)